jgi:hypothetical protein
MSSKLKNSKEFWIDLINKHYMIKYDCIQSVKKYNEK